MTRQNRQHARPSHVAARSARIRYVGLLALETVVLGAAIVAVVLLIALVPS